jgi:phage baseplate assembly protein W
MSIQRISRAFKDISLTFEPHPVTRDMPILVNERAISRSIRNLVETIPSERFFNSDIGSDIRPSLFEFVDFGTASVIEDQIDNIIFRYEPRVTDVDVTVSPTPDENSYEVTVIYTIIGQEIPSQPFTFILEATR